MSEAWPFGDLPRNHYRAIYADPPWAFNLWWGGRSNKTPAGVPSRATVPHYKTMKEDELAALPVSAIAADDAVLFLWITWPVLEWALRIISAWGFQYKTCGFCWVKANATQVDLFRDDIEAHMTLGYWTRSNSEVCLLATRGHPKRLNADVRQGIIEPRRQHSRKPDCVYERIERLVAGPYLELFARSTRPGWSSWAMRWANSVKSHETAPHPAASQILAHRRYARCSYRAPFRSRARRRVHQLQLSPRGFFADHHLL